SSPPPLHHHQHMHQLPHVKPADVGLMSLWNDFLDEFHIDWAVMQHEDWLFRMCRQFVRDKGRAILDAALRTQCWLHFCSLAGQFKAAADLTPHRLAGLMEQLDSFNDDDK